MNPANPKLSPDGQHVVHGFGDLYLDGRLLEVRGQYPGWLTATTVGYLDPDGVLRRLADGARLFHVPFNTVAMGGGCFIGTNTAEQRTYLSDGQSFPDTYCPAMEPTGQHHAYLTFNASLHHRVVRDGVTLSQGPIDDKLSLAGALAVWSEFAPLQTTYGWMPVAGFPEGAVLRLQATWQHYEVDPVVVLTPDGPWIVSHDDTRTLVRPWAQTWGYELPSVKTPHAMWDAVAGGLRVVGDAVTSVLNVVLDLTAPRVDLARQPGTPPIEPPIEPPPIDIIDPPPVEPPPVNPPEPPMATPYDEQYYLNVVRPDAEADYAAVQKPLDNNYPIWFSRTAYDQGAKNLTQEASWKKHRNEMRAALDPSGTTLPPL